MQRGVLVITVLYVYVVLVQLLVLRPMLETVLVLPGLPRRARLGFTFPEQPTVLLTLLFLLLLLLLLFELCAST